MINQFDLAQIEREEMMSIQNEMDLKEDLSCTGGSKNVFNATESISDRRLNFGRSKGIYSMPDIPNSDQVVANTTSMPTIKQLTVVGYIKKARNTDINFADLVREESLDVSKMHHQMNPSNFSHIRRKSIRRKYSIEDLQRERINLTHEYYKDTTQKLRQNLKNNKIFLNMVIHEMRNPTNQISWTIE